MFATCQNSDGPFVEKLDVYGQPFRRHTTQAAAGLFEAGSRIPPVARAKIQYPHEQTEPDTGLQSHAVAKRGTKHRHLRAQRQFGPVPGMQRVRRDRGQLLASARRTRCRRDACRHLRPTAVGVLTSVATADFVLRRGAVIATALYARLCPLRACCRRPGRNDNPVPRMVSYLSIRS